MNKEEVIIIGAGPAGLAAAMQLERYEIKPLLIEKEMPGGLLRNANLVENYPGFPGGIPGPQLVDLFNQQIKTYKLNILHAQVDNLDYEDERFELSVEGHTFYSNYAVIASGTKPRQIEGFTFPAEIKDKIFYEVYPLLDAVDRHIAILGAGDAAFDYGINLAKNNHVTIINRSRKISSLPLLWQRAQLNPRIQYLEQTSIIRLSAGSAEKIIIECNTPSGSSNQVVDYLIGAIGREPNLDFLSDQFAENAKNLGNSGKLFFAGDVVNGLYRQTAIAVGNGILTAMKIYKSIKEKDS